MRKVLEKKNSGALASRNQNRNHGRTWQLQTAKARFSEVFRLARTEGAQRITRQGKEAVVMMPAEDFDRLLVRSRQPGSIVQFFRQSPLVGLELNLERDKDTGREINL